MTWGTLDSWILVIAVLSAVACAIPGNFLVLRRMSLIGDAISHAVLPGIAIAFFVTNSRSSVPMFIGAVIVSILMTAMSEFISHRVKVEKNAALGAVFSSLFALGLLLIVQGADAVDLDPSCVLYGAIELAPLDTILVFGVPIPRSAIQLFILLAVNVSLLLLFYKEINLVAFDPALATTLGFNARTLHYVLMAQIAVTTVAVFEMVGSILVIAMLIVPPATAFLITKRLYMMIIVSVIFAIASSIGGHLLAIGIPPLLGFADTVIAGSIAVMSGIFFVVVVGIRIIVRRFQRIAAYQPQA